MNTTINNDWITLETKKNGVDVQRKFAGMDTLVGIDNVVQYCTIKYWERELYPNGDPIKTTLKSYLLEDLSQSVNEVEGWTMDPLPVLTGYIQTVGQPYIIDAARETLMSLAALPLDAEDGYILRRDTRTKIPT